MIDSGVGEKVTSLFYAREILTNLDFWSMFIGTTNTDNIMTNIDNIMASIDNIMTSLDNKDKINIEKYRQISFLSKLSYHQPP